VAYRSSKRESFSEDFPMTPKTIATLLILSAFAIAGANSASAQGGDFRGGGFYGGDNGFVGGYGNGGGYGNEGDYGNGGGYGNGGDKGYGDWYGISPGHKECPLFRKRVMTPDGWRVQMVPIC
jgi:hypothetical protein